MLAPSPAYPPPKNSTFNTQHSTFKKDESEHLENNSSDSHQHTDRYRYYARSNELHGIKTKTTAHLNMRRAAIFVLPRIPVMKGQSHEGSLSFSNRCIGGWIIEEGGGHIYFPSWEGNEKEWFSGIWRNEKAPDALLYCAVLSLLHCYFHNLMLFNALPEGRGAVNTWRNTRVAQRYYYFS